MLWHIDVWLSLGVLIVVVESYGNDFTTETACVGRCEYGYQMRCPSQERVAVQDLKYYAKQISDQCPDDTDLLCQDRACCNYNGGDCSVAFPYPQAFQVFRNCSGKSQCGWFRAESVETGSLCSYRRKTNYVAASYKCVKENSFIDVCSTNVIQGKFVNIQYNGDSQNQSGKAAVCSCVVSTSDCDAPARLLFKAVDVRLNSYHDINQCYHYSRFTITDTSGPLDFYCQKNYFMKGFRDLHYSYSPYARVSLYNRPGHYPSYFWLEITATMPDIDVIVTCGHQDVENLVYCGPPGIFTTTKHYDEKTTSSRGDVFGGNTENGNGDKQSGDKNETDTKKDTGLTKNDIRLIVAMVAGALVILLIIVIILICIKHRRGKFRKKPPVLPHPVPLSSPSSPIPSSFPSSDTEERYTEGRLTDQDKYGNYYESMAEPNGNVDNKSPFTPGKAMGSFFPNDRPKIAPPAPPEPRFVPNTPPVRENSGGRKLQEGNPYQAPWDASVFQAPTRVKKNDLAYATSDEIQVLIQRMENERGCLNEGPVKKPVPQTGYYIHIDDYKLKNTGSQKTEPPSDDLYVYESDDDSEEENTEGDQNNDESEDDTADDNIQGATAVEMNDGTPRSNDNFCGSEDTGYRSVGSPEHVLVSEDDYLVPGSVKSVSSKASTLKPSERGSVVCNSYGEPCDTRGSEAGSNSYGEPYDAVVNTQGATVDVKTKF